MNLKYLALGMIVGGGVLAAGCDDRTTPAPVATPAATDATVPPTMAKARDSAQSTIDAAQSKMNATGDDASAMAKDAGDKASTAGDGMVAQAQKLYDNAKSAMSKADFSGAQTYVDQLTAMKSKLPADWQVKVDELSKMLADGKNKLGGMSMPAMPK